MKVWINGNLVGKEEAAISVFDHCVLYGDGVFEGIRIYGGKIFQCDAHVDRLFASAEGIRLPIPLTKREIVDAMYETISANGIIDGYIRMVVTRGAGTLGLNPFKCSGGSVIIIADQVALYPPEMYENGLNIIIAKTRRISADMLSPTVKSCNYLNNVMARAEAVDAGAAEAIMLNSDGTIAEATGDNVFIVSEGAVITPAPEAGILIGITRKVVIDLCGSLGISISEQAVTVEQLYAADECFLTGTAAEVIAVTKIDGKVIGSGKAGAITKKLLAAFRQFIQTECGK